MAQIGYPRATASSPDSGRTGGALSSDWNVWNQIVTVFPEATDNHWVFRWNLHAGKTDSTAPTVQGVVQDVTSGGNAGNNVALTSSFAMNTAMSDGSTGLIYTQNLTTLYKLAEGDQFAAGFRAINARMGYGMRAADANPAGANNLFYINPGSSLPPVSSYDLTSYEGWIAVWLDSEVNVAPDKPTMTIEGLASTNSAAPSNVTISTPTMIGLFRDDNESVGSGPVFGVGQADTIRRFRYQVYRVSDGLLIHDSGTTSSSSSERTARQFSRDYDGPTLAAGTTYRVRCMVWDQFDASSEWSSYYYFMISTGYMDTPTTPTGKQNTKQPTPFAATWHSSGGLATNAVQIQIYDKDTASKLRDTGTLTKTVANNAVSSVTWASTGFVDLPVATNAYWIMRGRDTAGIWGGWTAKRYFTVNTPPYTPINSTSYGSIAPFATPPVLTAKVGDPDNNSSTGLQVFARLKTDPTPVNPSMNGNINGWMLHQDTTLMTETLSYDATQNYDGIGGSLKVNIASNTNAALPTGPLIRTVQKMDCVAGQIYSMQVATRTDNTSIRPRAHLRFYDNAGTLIQGLSESDYVPVVNTWSMRTWSMTAPVGATYFYLCVNVSTVTSSVNGNIWIDAADYTGYSVRSIGAMTFRPGSNNDASFPGGMWDLQLLDGANTQWTITRTGGTVSGGTFTLTDPETGLTTGAIPVAATAATVLTALESVYGVSNVTVTGGPLTTGGAYVITMARNQKGRRHVPITGNFALVTGGGTGVIAQTNEGGGGHLNRGYDTYHWDAYAFDGVWYSGANGITTESSAASSTDWTVIYAFGPEPVITGPSSLPTFTVTTARPTVTWTNAGPTQTIRRVQVIRNFEDGTQLYIHDFSDTSSSLSYQLPSVLSTGEQLHNGDTVTIQVTLYDANGLQGRDDIEITLNYPTPASLTLTASMHYARFDIVPTVVRLRWSQTTFPIEDLGAGSFLYYRISRTPSGDAVAANPWLDKSTEVFPKITTAARTYYDDHTALSNVEYDYRITQYVLMNGIDAVSSGRTYATLNVVYEATTIHDERDPDGTRIVLAARKDRTIRLVTNVQVLKPWNKAEPVHDRDNTFYHEFESQYAIIALSEGKEQEIIRRGKKMMKDGGPLVYRDGRENVCWGEMTKFDESDPSGGRTRWVTIGFRQLSRQVIDEEED